MQTAFVTGATGLLGNNLVRSLAAKGVAVRALVRSAEKARLQLGDVAEVEIVSGDMADTAGFADKLAGSDILFHTAAYFRDSYGGGDHASALHDTNVTGTKNLLEAAYKAGIRKMVHISSIAVLDGPRGAWIDETMVRARKNADPYYSSKIDTDEVVLAFLESKPDFHASLVLPGWMHGPGDRGPTSAGQVTLDFLHQKLPGITPGTFSVVDARDVAEAAISAATRGRRGERYLAAGRHMAMADLFAIYEHVSGVPAPKAKLPTWLLQIVASFSELGARVSKKPVLLSQATVKLMLREAERTRFDHNKSRRELGLEFRPIEDTLRDEIAWFKANGFVSTSPEAQKGY
ncbi:SDR family oxidoreductase [Novosphingobium sp. PASSN1]|uniref:SDR family oxidoreductase n=1 Tax=Novosphingobium sp. PASSN1 TaxID=2015561 RepID=UPI000BD25DF4|nr:SDR family oxidoreductase [Novosphingobium sp. PASSN1]OYU33765.1 MAG: oxidoreductase [Novosphingobium sp. PASSN1]